MCQNTTMRVNGAWIKYITSYIQKHTAHKQRVIIHDPSLVHDTSLGAPEFVKLVYFVVTSSTTGCFKMGYMYP